MKNHFFAKTLNTLVVLSALIFLLSGCVSKKETVAETIDVATIENSELSEDTSEAEANVTDPAEEVAVVEPSAEEVEKAITVPDVTTKTFVIPDSEAMTFVKNMKIGWNLGNTFDAVMDSTPIENELSIESAWVGVKTSKEMIDTLKAQGFNTIRIPVSWHNHLVDDNFTISEPWLLRVKEVVDYVVANDMTAIINIHHDIDPKFYYPSKENLTNSTKYMTNIWQQLATTFKDYDNHLIYESINEPRLKDTANEWWLDVNKAECMEAVDCINQLNQTFVDVVRATGGNNETRYLMVPGYAASPDNELIDAFTLPKDIPSNTNKLILSTHAYTPYKFALQAATESGSVDQFFIESTTSTGDIDRFMDGLYTKFVSQGIPVVIGEFGAREKNGNLQARINFSTYYIANAKARGITCVWWDNNAFYGSGENFGLLDRLTLKWIYPDIMTGLMKYAK